MTPTADRAAYRRGIVLTLLSRARFRAVAALRQAGLLAGLDPQTLLLCRFGPAAVVFWVVAAVLRARLGSLVGGPTAAVVSCVEPGGTVLMAVVLYDDSFGQPQIVGTAGVVAAVVLLQRRAAATESARPVQ